MQASEIMIKQLGYKKAKVMLQGLGNEHDAALLTYRRQNKIYEVGDLVVFSNSDETKPVLMKIKEFRNFNLVHLEIVSSGICGPSYKDDIRHANDVETTAGRRLDLPESVVKSLGEVS